MRLFNIYMDEKHKILPGTFIGELITIGKPFVNDSGLIVVKTMCNCGEENTFEVLELLNGNITDCGCVELKKLHKGKLSNNDRCINTLYLVYKSGAKKRNLSFTLTKYEFGSFLFKPCHYCNTNPLGIWKKTKSKRIKNQFVVKYNGIDRVNNDKGYIKHNCVTCCKICNKIKSKFGAKDFQEWLNSVAANYLINSKKINSLYINPNAQLAHFNTDDASPYHA